MNSFVPHMEIFLPSQQTVWSSLAPVRKAGFVLYGGTAVALRLGHRQSMDFDFSPTGRLINQGFTKVCLSLQMPRSSRIRPTRWESLCR